MKIYLIRHALSIANSLKIWTGQMDVDLSAAGIAEQRALSKRFKYPSADIYVSSPLLRCTHSLKLLYGRDADILMPEFMECSLGILEGKSYTNLNDDDNYLAWLREPDQAPPRGESFNSFRRRVESGFIKLLDIINSRQMNSAAVVLHGNVMRAVLHAFADPGIAHSDWKIPNGGLYNIDVDSADMHVTSWRQLPEDIF